MPPFGMKRFKRKEKANIVEQLNGLTPQRFCTPTGKNKDQVSDFSLIANLANQIFCFNGWSHSVTSQTVDFIDCNGEKYEVGVSALVKVSLQDGSFHEHVGYGISKGLKCKGAALAQARKFAAFDALKNSLSAFGQSLNFSRSGKITDYLPVGQSPGNKVHPTVSGVKRKLAPEFETATGFRLSMNDAPSQDNDIVEILPTIKSENLSPVGGLLIKRTSSSDESPLQVKREPVNLNLPSQSCLQNDIPQFKNPISGLDTSPSCSWSSSSKVEISGYSVFAKDHSNISCCVDDAANSYNGERTNQNESEECVLRKIRKLDLEIKFRQKCRNELYVSLNSNYKNHSQELFAGSALQT